jgi:hypothetical protein
MTIPWKHLGDYFYDNRVAIISGITLLVSSAVKTLPLPQTTFDGYAFFYDWAHQFLNITNTRPMTTPVITPPAAAAEPTGIRK